MKILKIEFDHNHELIHVYYKLEDAFFLQTFTFTVWKTHNHFNEDDLANLILEYG